MEASYMRRPGFRGRYLVKGQRAVYHVMSRTACGQYLFDDEAKGVFLKILRKQAGFCGVEVLSFCVMGNHFHLLIAVPEDRDIPDAELLRRYRFLYDVKRCPPSSPNPDVLANLLEADEEAGQILRDRILARMHDLSVFMRELKQRFGIWYNHRHENKGTIWAKRFTSVVVESTREALSTVAAYIDLNPVRAELVSNPADYRYSSYGRALGGERDARVGYEAVFCGYSPWKRLLPSYNLILYGKGYGSKGEVGKDRGRIDAEKLRQVMENGGKLPLSEILRLRVRYFTAGAAIGSGAFLREVSGQWKERHGVERKKDAHSMRAGEWGELRSYRNLQVTPVGPS
jgi:putative transposase